MQVDTVSVGIHEITTFDMQCRGSLGSSHSKTQEQQQPHHSHFGFHVIHHVFKLL